MSQKVTFQWSRLIKDLETGKADENAVKFYQDVIDECKKNDIILVLNLHHFDLPIELFGDQVHYWTTFNEPMVIPEAGYLCGFHYPKYVNKGKEAMQVIYNLNLASAKAIYDIAKNVQENYGNIPWFISENGMGVEGEERYINEEGSNCFGYHAWTGIDCWSWNNAYKNRYGFIALDLETQKRTVKKSGEWLRKVTEEHGYIAKDSYQ